MVLITDVEIMSDRQHSVFTGNGDGGVRQRTEMVAFSCILDQSTFDGHVGIVRQTQVGMGGTADIDGEIFIDDNSTTLEDDRPHGVDGTGTGKSGNRIGSGISAVEDHPVAGIEVQTFTDSIPGTVNRDGGAGIPFNAAVVIAGSVDRIVSSFANDQIAFAAQGDTAADGSSIKKGGSIGQPQRVITVKIFNLKFALSADFGVSLFAIFTVLEVGDGEVDVVEDRTLGTLLGESADIQSGTVSGENPGVGKGSGHYQTGVVDCDRTAVAAGVDDHR